MNSEIIPKNYATSNEIIYGAHFVTLVSPKVTYENPTGKFALSYATPNMSNGSEYSRTLPKNSTSNVINKDNLGTSKITTSNYITLTVPKHYFYITKIDIQTNITPCHLELLDLATLRISSIEKSILRVRDSWLSMLVVI